MKYPAFPQNLRQLCDNHWKQQKDIADDVDMSHVSLSRYFSGQNDPNLDCVVKLAQYFGVSIEWLLGLGGPKYNELPETASKLVDCYSRMSQSDKDVIAAILKKYSTNEPDMVTI